MVLNTRKLWSNGIKIASFFSKNYKKSPSGWGLRPQTPSMIRLRHTNLLITLPNLHFLGGLSPLPKSKSWLCANTQATTCDLQICSIFFPKKVPLSKISDDVIACDLWFGTPN